MLTLIEQRDTMSTLERTPIVITVSVLLDALIGDICSYVSTLHARIALGACVCGLLVKPAKRLYHMHKKLLLLIFTRKQSHSTNTYNFLFLTITR